MWKIYSFFVLLRVALSDKVTKKNKTMRYSCSIFVILTMILSFLTPKTSLSAPRNEARKGVGVVMSGGGAKGLYHIGVLEALEENGVPIDYVAGTSMGSIIAAMYASGYSPSEMRQIVLSGQVQQWVSGRIDKTEFLPYYRQVGRSPSFFNLWLDLQSQDKVFQIPSSLISSTQIDMALIELFAPASTAAKSDFSQLMIPFLCVAADMNAREPVTLSKGSLPEAVRSSMAIPLAFRPIEQNDRLLYDGGIYDNFPWRPLDEKFRPKLLIGSICTKGNIVPDADKSVVEQAFLLAMDDSDYTLPEGRSVTIQRPVEVGMLDFDNAEVVMNAGYEDAMRQMPQILEQISEPWSAEQYEERRKAFRARCPELIFNDYDVQGETEEQTAYLRRYLQTDLRRSDHQRQMRFSRMRYHLYSVLAAGNYTMEAMPYVTYDSITNRYAFHAKMKARPSLRLTIGGNISSTAFNQAYIGVNYQTFGKVTNTFGANLYLGPTYTWGTLGGRMDFHYNDPLFLTYSYTFSTKNLRHGSFGRLTPIDNTLSIRTSDSFGSLGLGVRTTHRSVAEFKIHGGHANYHYMQDDSDVKRWDHTRFFFGGAKVEYTRNTLDKYLYPTRGSELKVSMIGITGSERLKPHAVGKFGGGEHRYWWGARLQWNKVFDLPRVSWFSLGMYADAVYTTHPDFSTEGATLLSMPSFDPVPHARKICMPDFSADRFVAGGLIPTLDLMPNLFLRMGFYAMWRNKNHYERSNYIGWEDRQMHYISELSLVYHTPIGPVNLSMFKYDLNDWDNMYLMFNFGYPIFAPKATFY